MSMAQDRTATWVNGADPSAAVEDEDEENVQPTYSNEENVPAYNNPPRSAGGSVSSTQSIRLLRRKAELRMQQLKDLQQLNMESLMIANKQEMVKAQLELDELCAEEEEMCENEVQFRPQARNAVHVQKPASTLHKDTPPINEVALSSHH
ncbi:hypothetical protein CAPTEDRAFT_213754, partial [Capitella teleta]